MKAKLPWPENLKKTRPRMLVWEVLMRAEAPLTATQIWQRAQELAGGEVWLSTVYRFLDSLQQSGQVTRTLIQGSEMALYELCAGHRHYAVCLSCQRMLKLSACPIAAAAPCLPEQGFEVLSHKLEIYGYCRECRDLSKQQSPTHKDS